jgi:hypothetical protein
MSTLSQKDAVYNAVVQVLKSNGIDDLGDVSRHMTKDLRSKVDDILFNGFKNGAISSDRAYSDHELKAYVSNLQSNWIRKDTRLNGDTIVPAKSKVSKYMGE